MLEKIGHVKNPLTIIAFFAGLAEVSGTIVLPFLSPNIQGTYIWFLMLFPSLLVVSFFFILYNKHYVLYAPSDYRDDRSFTQLYENDYNEDKNLILISKIKESIEEGLDNIKNSLINTENTSKETISETVEKSSIDSLILAERSKIADSVSEKIADYVLLNTHNKDKNSYISGAAAFEKLIIDILIDLHITITSQNIVIATQKIFSPDIIAIKEDGTKIPIVIKYYREPLDGAAFILRLKKAIIEYMDNMSTDEAILIISSSISTNMQNGLTRLPDKYKLHIITGSTREILVPQLQSVFNYV